MMPFARAVNPYTERDPREDYLPIGECADAMGITVDQVKRLVAAGVLYTRWSRSGTLVQPVT
jgi:hypothetical protein